ncbi:MAG TPA: DMT family transporter [Hyphomicrobiaceae bacterium]|nr:DMT family transporter [Hyphomicrobiaceae bacterium]
MLGAMLAILSAASFAATNAVGRRGVVTGTPAQGMVLSNPVGVLCFVVVAALSGVIVRIGEFPPVAAAWMAAVGVLHFVVGRYANFRANQCAGTNLTAPVMQLNSVVTLILAVAVLREPCTVLQVVGGVAMVSGAFITQRQQIAASGAQVAFSPRVAEGVLFALLAALAYGTSPIMTRTALQSTGPSGAILGGLIAYGAATAAVTVMVLSWTSLRRNVLSVKRDSIGWFVSSGVLVAMAQGFLYAALSVAPILVVAPLLQLSLVFRFFFAMWLNPEHEVFGVTVVVGTVISILGACAVAIDTGLLVEALAVPESMARLLRWRI